MESQNHNLLVVNLDGTCVTSGSVEGIVKANSGVYSTSMSASMESPLIQLTPPIHCLGATVSRSSPNVAHLQPLQTVGYDSTELHHHTNLLTNNAIYQPVTGDVIHVFTPQQILENNNSFLSTNSLTHTLPIPSHPLSLPNTTTVETSSIVADIIDKSQTVEKYPSTIICEPAFPEDEFEYYEEIKSFLISKQLPPNKSDTYQTRLTERSKHYLVRSSKLYHNVRKPREVVMEKGDQLQLLQNAHVLKDTGVHIGMKKMFTKLKTKYFWRGMYTDIVSYTKNCFKCSEIADHRKQGISKDGEDMCNHASVSTRSIGTQCVDSWRVWRKVELQLHDSLPKTSSGKNKLLTVTDPVSCWVVAKALPDDAKEMPLITLISQFLFETFCAFGFTRCCFVGFSSNMKDDIAKELDSKRKNKAKSYLDSVIGEEESNCKWIVELVNDLVGGNPEWDQNLDNFLFDYKTGNFGDSDAFTPFSFIFNHNPFRVRTSVFDLETDENKENIVHDDNSSSMIRNAQNVILKCSVCKEMFTSQMTLLSHQESHCKIFPVTTDKTKSLKCRIVSEKSGQTRLKDTSPSAHPPTTSTADVTCTTSDAYNVCMENTVSAVKALLEATRDERRKRGNYQKFPPEIQKQMAEYGIKHGSTKAAKFFTVQLRKDISVRTIRTVMNLHANFNPRISEIIGRFATKFGIKQASKYFSEKLKRNVSLALVRKFQKAFLKTFPDSNVEYPHSKRKAHKVKIQQQCSTSKRILDKNLQKSIGHYASRHSISETIKHFKPEIQMNINEEMVKECLNIYMSKIGDSHQTTSSSNSENRIRSQSGYVVACSPNASFEPEATSESISRNASENQLAPQSPTGTDTALIFNHDALSSQIVDREPFPATVIVSQTDHFSCPNFSQNSFNSQHTDTISHASLSSSRLSQVSQSQISSCPSSYYVPNETRYNIGCQSIASTHSGMIVDSVNSSNSNVADFSTTRDSFQVQCHRDRLHILVDNSSSQSSNTLKKTYSPTEDRIASRDHDYSTMNIMNSNNQNFFYLNCKNSDSVDCSDTQDEAISISFKDDVDCSLQSISVIENETIEDSLDESSSSSCSQLEFIAKVKKSASGKIKCGKKKRGSYTAYSPELRADIGRYAAEHGCFEARLHFQNVLGQMIPESTMRGLREKYIKKQAHCKVTSLGYNQRGRPLRLGKYDEVVQQSLKQLIRSGERVSSFVVIATAKQILNSVEPQLLEENGGPIKLNTTWAKSFLKRIGVHNNS